MSQSVSQLVEASKALSVDERIELAQAIWNSLPATPEGWQPSAATMTEIRRRMDEHDRDPDSAITAEEMRVRLAQLRSSL